MSDTMTFPRSTNTALDRRFGRPVSLAVAVLLVMALAVLGAALAWPTDSSEPVRAGTGTATAVGEFIDCRPGQPC